MNNISDCMVVFGLDGIVDSADSSKYTYKQFIVDCFRSVFPMHELSADVILHRSQTWALSNKFRILTGSKADYEDFILHYVEWVLNDEDAVTEVLHNAFIKETKVLFKKLTVYQDIIDYMIKLRKACCVGVVSDRDWFGCQIINSYIEDYMFDYIQHYWPSGYFKDTDEAWNFVVGITGKDRANILVVDTSKSVINKVVNQGYNGYIHTEGDLISLSKEINKFLSSRGVNTK